jgi:hypothetical protein
MDPSEQPDPAWVGQLVIVETEAAGNWTCVLHDVTDKGVVIVALEDTHQPAPRIQKHGDLGPGETLLPWSSVRAIKLSEAEQSE